MTSSKYALMQQASIGPLDTLFRYDVLLVLHIWYLITLRMNNSVKLIEALIISYKQKNNYAQLLLILVDNFSV